MAATAYEEFKQAQQRELDAFMEKHVFFAFSNEQFREGLEKLDLAHDDKVVSIGAGGFCRKSKVKDFIALLDKKRRGLSEHMVDFDFAYDAFMREMYNHEYEINWQGNWDVLSKFGSIEYSDEAEYNPVIYMDALGFGDDTKLAFHSARSDYLTSCQERGWL